jgi:hypothetical protein
MPFSQTRVPSSSQPLPPPSCQPEKEKDRVALVFVICTSSCVSICTVVQAYLHTRRCEREDLHARLVRVRIQQHLERLGARLEKLG